MKPEKMKAFVKDLHHFAQPMEKRWKNPNLPIWNILIILFSPLCRIQLLIFPKIPDPEKVLKRMFEEQREEYLPADYSTELIKPDTISR